MKTCVFFVTGLAVLTFTSTTLAQHADDLIVARNSAGALAFEAPPLDEEVFGLEPVDGPLFFGWTGTEPGFGHLPADEPEEDLFVLEQGVQVRLEVVGLDAALRAIDTAFQVLDQPGERTLLGGAMLHTHVTWHVNSQDPQYDGQRTLWCGTFRLVDTGSTAYSPSQTFTICFATTECATADVNADEIVNNFDIDPFVAVLVNPASATAQERCAADVNRDGTVNNFDIDPFVQRLTE